MRRGSLLIQLLALTMMCACATVDTVDQAGNDSLPQEGVPKGTVTEHTRDSSRSPGWSRWMFNRNTWETCYEKQENVTS